MGIGPDRTAYQVIPTLRIWRTECDFIIATNAKHAAVQFQTWTGEKCHDHPHGCCDGIHEEDWYQWPDDKPFTYSIPKGDCEDIPEWDAMLMDAEQGLIEMTIYKDDVYKVTALPSYFCEKMGTGYFASTEW